MSQVSLSADARADLLEIGEYLAEQSGNDDVAYRFLNQIDEKCHLLAKYPLAGESRPDLAVDVRCFPVGNYLLFYRAIQSGIELVRVFHGARDVPAAFRNR